MRLGWCVWGEIRRRFGSCSLERQIDCISVRCTAYAGRPTKAQMVLSSVPGPSPLYRALPHPDLPSHVDRAHSHSHADGADSQGAAAAPLDPPAQLLGVQPPAVQTAVPLSAKEMERLAVLAVGAQLHPSLQSWWEERASVTLGQDEGASGPALPLDSQGALDALDARRSDLEEGAGAPHLGAATSLPAPGRANGADTGIAPRGASPAAPGTPRDAGLWTQDGVAAYLRLGLQGDAEESGAELASLVEQHSRPAHPSGCFPAIFSRYVAAVAPTRLAWCKALTDVNDRLRWQAEQHGHPSTPSPPLRRCRALTLGALSRRRVAAQARAVLADRAAAGRQGLWRLRRQNRTAKAHVALAAVEASDFHLEMARAREDRWAWVATVSWGAGAFLDAECLIPQPPWASVKSSSADALPARPRHVPHGHQSLSRMHLPPRDEPNRASPDSPPRLTQSPLPPLPSYPPQGGAWR